MSEELKPFQKVLVRDYDSDDWQIDLFEHEQSDGRYNCLTSIWHQCIPYEGNERLLCTNEDSPGEFKWGDKVEVSNYKGEGNWVEAIFIKTNALNNYIALQEGNITPIEFRYCRHADW